MIRDLEPADLPIVARLEAVCAANAWTLEDYRQLFRDHPGCGGFLCEIGGKPVGYLVHQPTECTRYVTGLGVTPFFRGQGLGRKLMQRMIDSGRPLSLHVRKGNETARNLYRSLGFFKLRVQTNYYEDGEDAILMFRP